MSFEERVLELNEFFFQLYQNRFFQEKKTCSKGPLARYTYNDLRVLERIERSGVASMKDLSEALSLPMSTLTGIADKLVKDGFIERFRTEADRRVVQVKISPRGNESLALRKNAHIEVSRRLLGSLTEEEQAEFLRLFRKAVD